MRAGPQGDSKRIQVKPHQMRQRKSHLREVRLKSGSQKVQSMEERIGGWKESHNSCKKPSSTLRASIEKFFFTNQSFRPRKMQVSPCRRLT